MEMQRLIGYIRSNLDLKNANLGDEYFYQCLPLCVIDAVYSINANYKGTRATVMRYCEFFDMKRLCSDRDNLPPREEQQTIASFIAKIEERGHKYFAEQVFLNRQRTSTRNGILKADAVYRFAKILTEYGVECLQDVEKVAANENFDLAIRKIPGQTTGVSLNYFFMLAGSDEFIKPDRHILAFIKGGIGRTVSVDEAQTLLGIACNILQTNFPHLTLRLLDNAIWNYQRRIIKKGRNDVCKTKKPGLNSTVTANGSNGMDEDVKKYVRRLIDGHKSRIAPMGKDYLTQSQNYVYEVVKYVFEKTGENNISGKEVKKQYRRKYGRDMQLLLSDFCYNLVNVGPDFKAKFLFYTRRSEFEYVDFSVSSDKHVPIIWNPKGKNVPPQLSGRQFCVGQYYHGTYNWDFSELSAL
ncbi:MAG: hypothetical protein KKH02_09690 [Proteobacteria bacterium]|nr:hypothetical protein [Pseudomonadota bacterium]MCG2740116.1 hypothetical protein [Syntrophaceae bacterium]